MIVGSPPKGLGDPKVWVTFGGAPQNPNLWVGVPETMVFVGFLVSRCSASSDWQCAQCYGCLYDEIVLSHRELVHRHSKISAKMGFTSHGTECRVVFFLEIVKNTVLLWSQTDEGNKTFEQDFSGLD